MNLDAKEAAPPTVCEHPPVWIRLPKNGGQCRHFGFSRTSYYDLMREGLIAYKVVRQRGKLRGVRLINYQSVLHFVAALPDPEE